MRKPLSLAAEADALRDRLAALIEDGKAKPLSGPRRRRIDSDIRALMADLEAALIQIDPVALPTSVFDPANPSLVGRFTALALVAQGRHPLSAIPRFYGAGVYAIYYKGQLPLYAPLSGSETPIYVGKASPTGEYARTPREHGERLAARLNEHRKNIGKADSTLDVEEFEARFLVVQSGSEKSAEDYLITLFRPIWNSETGILYGLGKHGDDPETRGKQALALGYPPPWSEVGEGDQGGRAYVGAD